ncbi:hypothetical protein [Curtobacterium sp. P97]|uniref:hypothetical protein n=1 Tax=Curtobacterium sp. P97 TaxID=2939562 RepID=UPI00203D1803|nr:hypothetical protein [Curtobacterium sp. P97]MCM3521977.1 hypothetical protein [Curtobacterium sp. P97]
MYDLRFEQTGVLAQVKALAVARSDDVAYVEVARQRLQPAWAPSGSVTARTRKPRDR